MDNIYILLYPARGFAGRLIRWQTRSKYSHAAIVVGAQLWESLQGKGVLTRPLERADMSADWFRVAALVDSQNKIIRWLNRQVGKPYDWTMVIRFVTRRQETRKTRGKWFCSELVFAALKRYGVQLFARTEPWEVSPGMLVRSVKLVEEERKDELFSKLAVSTDVDRE